MKSSNLLAIVLAFGSWQASSQTHDSIKVVISHVFFCIDSVSYQNLFKHEFITTLFADTRESSSKTITDSWTGKYIMGRQSYVEAFRANATDTSLSLGDKFGDLGIVFRTKKPGDIQKIDTRIKLDNRDTRLEVLRYDADGKIIPFNYNLHLSNVSLQETFRPYVEEFTVEFLDLCGFSESEITKGITEEQFREKRRGKSYNKLFDNIQKIELTLTDEELEYLAETLKYIGFSRKANRFTNDRLEILCMLEPNRTYKLKALHFTLLNESKNINIEISKNLIFTASGNKASFQFNYR